MNTIYNIGYQYNGTQGGLVEPIRVFKGETEISFDLRDLAEGEYSVAKIIIDFNDDSPLLVKEYTFGDDRKVVSEIFKKTYYPDISSYYIVYYPTIYITYSNFRQFKYQAVIKIAKESFYSQYENLEIGASQFVDNTQNSIFTIIDTAKGDNFNLIIK
jgi:hypothetical protein